MSKTITQTGLTTKEQMFCMEYLKTLNGPDSILEAGYRCKDRMSARNMASRMLAKVYIQDFIQKEFEKRMKKLGKTVDNIIEELNNVGFADIKQFLSFDNENGIVFKSSNGLDTRAVESVKTIKTDYYDKNGNIVSTRTVVSMRLHDKLKALDLLGRYNRMWEGEQLPTPKTQNNILIIHSNKSAEEVLKELKKVSSNGINNRNDNSR